MFWGRRRNAGQGQQINAGRRRLFGGRRAGLGPSGNCVCPSCGTKVAHQVGTPCNSIKCPNCGTLMIRES